MTKPIHSFDDLRGKVALVTGASSGIGAAVALAFASWGMPVAVHYRSKRAEAEALVESKFSTREWLYRVP